MARITAVDAFARKHIEWILLLVFAAGVLLGHVVGYNEGYHSGFNKAIEIYGPEQDSHVAE